MVRSIRAKKIRRVLPRRISMAFAASGLGGRHGYRGARASRDLLRAVALAPLESRETPDGDVLADLRNRVVDQLLHRHGLVLDEVLFVQAILFVELFHLAGNDLLDDRFWFTGLLGLFFVNFAFAIQGFLGDF